jgi:uncharacterized protein with GYD domain
MPKYLYLGTYTPEAWAAMIKDPPDRAGAAAKLAESLGGSTECFYYAFGDFDFMTIMDLPDDAAAAALSLAVTSTGRVKQLRTHPLLTGDDVPAMFGQAQTALGSYEVPGD